MQIFGLTIERRRQKAAGTDLITQWPASGSGWWPIIREGFAGAWQRGITEPAPDPLSHSTAWACFSLIASDISKVRIKLVEHIGHDVWTETENAAFSPVLRKPNHFQTRIKFIEQWVLSKLIRGNTYILKERDGSGIVRGLYVLDPSKVSVLVAPSGDVYYALGTDYLSGVTQASVMIPAREIMHDVMVPLYHPLCGVSALYACGRAAMQSLKIQQHSERFFENGQQLSGVLTAPSAISNEVAKRIQDHWDANYTGQRNAGKVAVLGDGLKFDPMSMTSVDAQLIEQLKLSDERICSSMHVPPYMVGIGAMPSYNNIEALTQQYYGQCLQNLFECIEALLDDGLALPKPFGTEFDIDGGLLRMDTATRVKAAADALLGGMAPNEARARYHGLGPVKGGETPYMQEQNWPLQMLANRELPTRAPTPPAPLPPAPEKTIDYQAVRRKVLQQVAA